MGNMCVANKNVELICREDAGFMRIKMVEILMALRSDHQ
jgi:hypothetical protein